MKALGVAIAVAYPFLIYAGLRWMSARTLALLIGALLLARGATRLRGGAWKPFASLAGPALVAGVFVGVVWVADDGRYFKGLPVVVNLALFVVFARTLSSGPPMIERFARLHHATPPPGSIPYCRRVTVVWSAFFVANALFILWLAVNASLATWTIYTGIIAYMLAGLLFAGEMVYRAWRFRYYEDNATDALMRRIFPPRVST